MQEMILHAWYPTRAKCLKPPRLLSVQWYFPAWKPATTTNIHRLIAFITRYNFCCQTIGRTFGTKSESCSGFIGQKTPTFPSFPERSCLAFAVQPKEKMNWVLESLKPGQDKHNYMKKSILFPEGKRQESPLKSPPSVQECGEISRGATRSLDPTS